MSDFKSLGVTFSNPPSAGVPGKDRRDDGGLEIETILIWQPNWKAVIAFLDLETQWRVAGIKGIYLGLDYTAAAAVLTRRKFRKLLPDLRIMELAALSVLNERDE